MYIVFLSIKIDKYCKKKSLILLNIKLIMNEYNVLFLLIVWEEGDWDFDKVI